MPEAKERNPLCNCNQKENLYPRSPVWLTVQQEAQINKNDYSTYPHKQAEKNL